MNFAQSKKLSSIKGVVHGFANRHISMDASKIKQIFGISTVAQLKQIHSGDVVVLRNIETHDNNLEGDALVTDITGLGIGIRTADCVPILITDHNTSLIAAVHAGWRGTYLEIALNTVKKIESEFGILPSDLTAVIGPSIRKCCYEVGEDVALQFYEKFTNADSYLTSTGNSKYLLDLSESNRTILQSAGVEDIEVLDICTKCKSDYNSYRREGKGVNTQLSFIALA